MSDGDIGKVIDTARVLAKRHPQVTKWLTGRTKITPHRSQLAAYVFDYYGNIDKLDTPSRTQWIARVAVALALAAGDLNEC